MKIIFRVGLVLLKSMLGTREKLKACQGQYETMEILRAIEPRYMQEGFLVREVTAERGGGGGGQFGGSSKCFGVMTVLIPWLQKILFSYQIFKKNNLNNNKNTLALQLKAFIFRFAGDSYRDFLQINFIGFPSLSATSLALKFHFALF